MTLKIIPTSYIRTLWSTDQDCAFPLSGYRLTRLSFAVFCVIIKTNSLYRGRNQSGCKIVLEWNFAVLWNLNAGGVRMDKRLHDIAVVIPAFEPGTALPGLLGALRRLGFAHIVLVDDGSPAEYAPVFRAAQAEYACVVLRHAANLGKGRALKTAFNYILTERGDLRGAVTMDADGRHAPEDAAACAAALADRPDALVLACPDPARMNGAPLRVRFSRQCARRAVQFLSGIRVSDPQTALRGMSRELMLRFLATEGERYEYEMNVLLDTKELDIPIHEVLVAPPKAGQNTRTHFRPLLDSLRIYAVFLKFLVSSLSSYALDIILFTILVPVLRDASVRFAIPAAAYIARAFSASFNYIINKKTIFKSRERTARTMFRYLVVCILQITLSAFVTDILVHLTKIPPTAVKILVDSALFFFSYTMQKDWVFRAEKPDAPADREGA